MNTTPKNALSSREEGKRTQTSNKGVSTTIKAMLRSKKGAKRGVYVRVTINREQLYFATGYYIRKLTGFRRSMPESVQMAGGIRKGLL